VAKQAGDLKAMFALIQ